MNHVGAATVITNTGGSAENFGATTQAPVVTRRVPDSGPTFALLLSALFSLQYLKSRR